MNKKLLKIIVPIFSFLLSIICLEFIFSFLYPTNDRYYVSTPKERNSYPNDGTLLKGISDTSNVNYNNFGARSDEILPLTHHKIIAFGGSTTECFALDQKKTWTAQLQAYLNKKNDSIRYWVGNFGKAGNETNHHILQTEQILKYEELKNTETVLYLIGYNDLINATKYGEEYLNPNLLNTKLSAFSIVPDKELPLHKRTGIWKFSKQFKRNLKLKQQEKNREKIYLKSRYQRKKIKKNNNLPNLTRGIIHYKENINSLINICKSRGKRPVFMTQPVLWRPNITTEGEDKCNYFSNLYLSDLDTESLYLCMKAFNDALVEVCKENNVKCIDIFESSHESWFYDNCHYTEKGAQEMAKIIYENISY